MLELCEEHQHLVGSFYQKILTKDLRVEPKAWSEAADSLTDYSALLLCLNATIKNMALQSNQEPGEYVEWESFVQKKIQQVALLRNVKRTASSEVARDCLPTITLHKLGSLPTEIMIAMYPMWQWLVWCWLDYLLEWGTNRPITLLASLQPRYFILKGVGNWDVQEQSLKTEVNQCPLCQSYVRNLYAMAHRGSLVTTPSVF